jgi:hypothetical protein
VFEELIRKFSEISNETAGEHFTPREVIRLMVNLIFIEDDDILSKPGVVRTIYHPLAYFDSLLLLGRRLGVQGEPGEVSDALSVLREVQRLGTGPGGTGVPATAYMSSGGGSLAAEPVVCICAMNPSECWQSSALKAAGSMRHTLELHSTAL